MTPYHLCSFSRYPLSSHCNLCVCFFFFHFYFSSFISFLWFVARLSSSAPARRRRLARARQSPVLFVIVASRLWREREPEPLIVSVKGASRRVPRSWTLSHSVDYPETFDTAPPTGNALNVSGIVRGCLRVPLSSVRYRELCSPRSRRSLGYRRQRDAREIPSTFVP